MLYVLKDDTIKIARSPIFSHLTMVQQEISIMNLLASTTLPTCPSQQAEADLEYVEQES